ncbi:MAG: Metallophosphoesterase [Thermoleophilia bacterium]|nr:Metallophosphoesterase [Thermoleophilia bacterium]
MTGGFAFGDGPAVTFGQENYYVTVTNASRDRDITVTHVWFDTEPRVDIVDGDLPVRLRYSEPWETAVSIETVPAEPPEAFWLARCLLAPDDKVVKSRPRKNVPPFGRVPRGGSVS